MIRDWARQDEEPNEQSINPFHFFFRFGPGPHKVELNLQFPPGYDKLDESVPDKARIVLELAPVDEMPHTVYWFLEQVSRQLYDFTSFHRNAGKHVIIYRGYIPLFEEPICFLM